MSIRVNISDLHSLTPDANKILDVLERHEHQTMLGSLIQDAIAQVKCAVIPPKPLARNVAQPPVSTLG